MTIKIGTSDEFLRRKLKQERYPGFPYPPTFDVGLGHNRELRSRDFRLGMFRILEERDDYLICRGYDPNSSRKLRKRIKVAKPTLLQRTPWDGHRVTVAGKDVTFNYQLETQPGMGRLRRIATATVYGDDGVAEEIVEIQRITMDYLVDDIISATQNRKTSFQDYIDVRTESGVRIHWVDVNISGRCWAVDLGEDNG